MSSPPTRSASASATALFPLAVGPKIATTSRRAIASGCDVSCDPTSQGGRRRAFDQHVDQLAGLGGAREVDGRVAARAPAEEPGVVSARALDEDLLDAPDPRLVTVVRDPLHN